MTPAAGDRPIPVGEPGSAFELFYCPGSGRVSTCGAPSPSAPRPSPWESEIAWPITRLAFATTEACNLRCHFCYNRFHRQGSNLPRSLMFGAVDDLARQNDLGPSVGLIFSGGEPLLRWREVRATIEHARKRLGERGVGVDVTLYSNGTLLTEEIIEVLRDQLVHVVLSIDGPQEVHDRHRRDARGRGMFFRAIRNLRRLQDMGMADQVQARSVILDPDVRPLDVLETLLSEGLSRVHLMPAYGTQKSLLEPNPSHWLNALRVYEQLLLRGYLVEITPFYRLFRKILNPRRFADSFLPCTAGRTMIGVGADGWYYLCHHFSGAETRLGRVGLGLPSPDRYRGLAATVNGRSPCSDCWARHLCGGPCYHREYVGGAPVTIEDCAGWLEVIHQTLLTTVRLVRRVPHTMELLSRGLVHVPADARARFMKHRINLPGD